MAKQVQIQVRPRPRPDEDSQDDAPTVSKSIAKIWFGGGQS